MHKKLGPLQAWQWAEIVGGGLLLYYFYRRHAASASAVTATGTPAAAQTGQTDLGPIDPTTGQPYSLEGAYNAGAAGAANQNSGPTSLQQELADLAAIEALMQGLQPQTPAAAGPPTPGTPPPTVDTSGGTAGGTTSTVATSMGGKVGIVSRAQKKVSHIVSGGIGGGKHATEHHHHHHNPGHTVTHWPDGRKSARSSEPHNPRQHRNVAAPNHQRHPTDRHVSYYNFGPAAAVAGGGGGGGQGGSGGGGGGEEEQHHHHHHHQG